MTSIYIYYKVSPDAAASLQDAVQAMQSQLRSAMPGLAASLHLREDDTTAEVLTWMEVYQFNGHADARAWQTFDEALSRQIPLLPAGIQGERHTERFRALPVRPSR
jgi:hypothetical protein